ncbi:MAG TPA: serine/threonine-protein kinase [Thermoanaerobaculia bacterium]
MNDPERWRTVDRLFAQALELPPAERGAFLDDACAGDEELRREVETLLAADERNSTFLERPAGEILGWRALTGEEEEGGRLGPYRLLRRIGGGGMGTVYLARRDDAEYQQDVAIKILRAGLEGTEAYHRFLAERQILARLQHPNIARLYDGGTTADGRPFLVMELVDGVPVDRYCDERQLTVDQRLDLFRRICSAVEYAHQNLLVHRDLKPGNILVTADGEPKLLDFGIAKQLEPKAAADPAPLTRTGLRVMTPSYASPEQVKGEPVTTASDVYTLGVLLYEMLTGRSPYPAAEVTYEIERAICEQEPERPSAAVFRAGAASPEEIARARKIRPQALQRRLRGDLDNVILMALRKEPGRRYRSVAQLSRDLERHQEDLPVIARPDTLRYRTRKFVRRHRAAVAAAVVVALVVAGFMASLFRQHRLLVRERDKAQYALSFLVDTFKNADPYHARGERLTAQEILDQGTRRVGSDLKGRPDVQAAVMQSLGEAQFGLGQYDKAEPLLKRALLLRSEMYGPRSLEVAESLEQLGRVRFERSDAVQGERLLREALAIKRRLLGSRHIEVARTLNLLGSSLSERQVSRDLEKFHDQALTIARAEEGPKGLVVAETLTLMAKLKMDLGDYAASEKLFREGLAMEREILGERDPQYLLHRTVFGESLLEQGKYKEAEELLRQNLKVQEKILGRDHPDFIGTGNNLALALHNLRREAEAEALYRDILPKLRAKYGPDHWMVGSVAGNLAITLQAQNRGLEAIPLYKEALEVRRKALGPGHPEVAGALLLLASLHRELELFPEGIRLALEAQEIVLKAEGPDHPHMAFVQRELGRNHLARKRFAEAEPYLRRSLEIRRKGLAPDNPDLAKSKSTLAECLKGLGRYEEAETLAREAGVTLAAQFGPQDERVVDNAKLLAAIREARGTRIASR